MYLNRCQTSIYRNIKSESVGAAPVGSGVGTRLGAVGAVVLFIILLTGGSAPESSLGGDDLAGDPGGVVGQEPADEPGRVLRPGRAARGEHGVDRAQCRGVHVAGVHRAGIDRVEADAPFGESRNQRELSLLFPTAGSGTPRIIVSGTGTCFFRSGVRPPYRRNNAAAASPTGRP